MRVRDEIRLRAGTAGVEHVANPVLLHQVLWRKEVVQWPLAHGGATTEGNLINDNSDLFLGLIRVHSSSEI